MDDPASGDSLGEGVRLFNEGFFFEAHEIWEELWRREHGESRMFVQGLIQVAAGYHHHRNGNPTGAVALFRKALAKLRRYPGRYMGIDLESLRDVVEGAEAFLSRREASAQGGNIVPIPQIRLHRGAP
jgi:hypothetical protein